MNREDSQQQQFLQVIDRDEAERRWRDAFSVPPDGCGRESMPLQDALGRVLADDVVAEIDVPCFDRSNLDGFAVRAADTYGAEEERPALLTLAHEVIATGVVPEHTVRPGEAVSIATGGMLPRGADAIVMVEHTNVMDGKVSVYRSVTPGRGLTFAGTDIARGETVYRRGDLLTSRETGVLAAIGTSQVSVYRRPRVGILSTGDEIIPPSESMRPGLVFDSNAQVLADAVQELGGEPVRLGIIPDDLDALRNAVHAAIESCDLVLLSGGTSKGAGDLSYRVFAELEDPGIVAHGVALKPGKPICLGATCGKPVVILPGFPTSAIFTFHEFVADVVRELGGRSIRNSPLAAASMATPFRSEIGRTEFLLVGLVRQADSPSQLAAYPMGKGSGSVTAFGRADGFVTIDRHTEFIEEGSDVNVTLLGHGLQVADLVVIGSHCVGLDFLLSEAQRMGIRSKFLAVGSTAGLRAVERGECDIAGIHLLDAKTNQYNEPFLSPGIALIAGYRRQQGIVFRRDDSRFLRPSRAALLNVIRSDSQCVMVNRNQGSGTRILIDRLLDGYQPQGYPVQAKSHNAVAASIVQRRGDWGVTIETVAKENDLGFFPLQSEQYDFAVRAENRSRAIEVFQQLLQQASVRKRLAEFGFV